MKDDTKTLKTLIQQHELTGRRILKRMQKEAVRAGLQTVAGPAWHDADFGIFHDPADGSRILRGVWRRANGKKIGEITVRENGGCWAEWDVVKPHPLRPGWFIEAMTAWGPPDDLRSEPRLLPLPGK